MDQAQEALETHTSGPHAGSSSGFFEDFEETRSSDLFIRILVSQVLGACNVFIAFKGSAQARALRSET